VSGRAGWSVYVVRCADGTLYVGLAKDVDARVATHNRGGGARYTRARRPVRLRWSWTCSTAEDARRLEGLLKREPRARRLRAIAGDPEVLGLLLVEVAARRRASIRTRASP